MSARSVVIFSMSLLLTLALLGYIFAESLETQLRCRLLSANYGDNSSQIFVSSEDYSNFVEGFEGFSHKNNLIFGISYYPGVSEDQTFTRTVLAACNKDIEIYVSNTFNENIFAVRVGRHSKERSIEFESLNNSFESEIVRFYEFVERDE